MKWIIHIVTTQLPPTRPIFVSFNDEEETKLRTHTSYRQNLGTETKRKSMLLPTVCEAAVKFNHGDQQEETMERVGYLPLRLGYFPRAGRIRLFWKM